MAVTIVVVVIMVVTIVAVVVRDQAHSSVGFSPG